MYAELCEALAQQLPELAPPKGETKPMSFQRLLLNHCQDQFEGTLERRKVRARPACAGRVQCCIVGVDVIMTFTGAAVMGPLSSSITFITSSIYHQ
jgi:hypothetical protein